MKAILNFYIYSALHISICAVALCWNSFYLLNVPVDWFYIAFVGSGTCLLYSLHKLIGQQTVYLDFDAERFHIVGEIKFALLCISFIAGIASIYSFYNLDMATIKSLSIPCVLSAMYILPMFLKQKRLRDFHYVKIFLVAACWAWLCAIIPSNIAQLSFTEQLCFGIEKGIFIFAITLPFDYRDIEVDQKTAVKTLAHLFGDSIHFVIAMSFVICILCCHLNILYSLNFKWILTAIYIILWAITYYAMRKKHDYYYSGLIDATILIFSILASIAMQYG